VYIYYVKLHEKIIQIRQEKGLKIMDLHHKLKETFKKKALSYRTLLRIEKGETDGRGSSLYQICVGLGITLKELQEGTEQDTSVADFSPRNRRQGRYTYNKKAYAEILTGPSRLFLAMEVVLLPEGKTSIEKDPNSEEIYEKMVYVTRGKILCIVDNVKFPLGKGDSLSFKSSLPHSLENNSSRKSHCIIFQKPRHI